MFEKAARLKLRFPFRGEASVEDLWDMTVQELDSVYKILNAKSKQAKEESLLETRTPEDTVLDLKIEIIKHVVGVKISEAAERAALKEKIAKRKKILGILADKEDAELLSKSKEELQKELDNL